MHEQYYECFIPIIDHLEKNSFKVKYKSFDVTGSDISNNLGDSKTLITHPDTTTHHRLGEKEKISLRITKNLVRLSVGLEDSIDLIGDIDNALKKAIR